MVGSKKKHGKSSERSYKQQTKKKLNPFEVHINREKLKVLGKKNKNDRGLPGVSREKALNKRRHTLQQEFKLHNKANRFVDKRIGESDVTMTEEDRFIARYAKLKAKHHKKSIYNLADEEVLTHKGQALSEIEKFEDTKSDDDDDGDSLEGDKIGNLDEKFVDEAHFGGGVLKRTGIDGAKSHKDLIEQLIAESKKRKAEKQKLKEETLELTEKLDSEWKDLLPLVNKTKSSKATAEIEKADEYDKTVKQLKFEARGTPSDRLKSEDEIAKEEREKLEQLEKERLQRMRGITTENNRKPKHFSADDLDDNFAYDSEPEVTLSYNQEGVANVLLEAELNGKVITPKKDGEESDNDDAGESAGGESEAEDESEAGDASEGEEESEAEDNLSDLKESDSASESDSDTNMDDKIKPDAIRDDLLKRKEVMEKAREELPYTFKFPDNYEELQLLLQFESSERQFIILERLIKCNHPSLGNKNKENLELLFAYLLQYINDISEVKTVEDISKCFNVFSNLVPHLFNLAETSPLNAHTLVLDVLKEKHQRYRKNKQSYPGIEMLLFLKLVSCIFPTSDFRHVVVTPAIVFIDQMLNKCKVRTRRDIAYGLFLTTLVLEYTTLAKRFLPTAINFLTGILHMAIPKAGVKLIKICPPFKTSSNTLVLCNNYNEANIPLTMNISYLLPGEIDDVFKMRAIYLSVCLLKEFVINFAELDCSYEIFLNVMKYLNSIPMNNYPVEIREALSLLQEEINKTKANRRLQYLTVAKPKPKALRLYEPRIEKVYDTKKRKVESKEKAEQNKLLHKLKREQKGALREIRRDNAFISRLKIGEQIRSDNERKTKVRKLLSDASIQQSELNMLDRKKKRKK